MEWEFVNGDRRGFEISESGRIRSVEGNKNSKVLRLSKNTKLSSNYEMKVKVNMELESNATMDIGLADHYELNQYGLSKLISGSIHYGNYDGNIYDKGQKVKTLNQKLQKDYIIKVKNEVVKETNDKEKIFKMTLTINHVKVGVSFYLAEKHMLPYLILPTYIKVELDVEINGNSLTNFNQIIFCFYL